MKDGEGPGFIDSGPNDYFEIVKNEHEAVLKRLNEQITQALDVTEKSLLEQAVAAEQSSYRERLRSIDRSLW